MDIYNNYILFIPWLSVINTNWAIKLLIELK